MDIGSDLSSTDAFKLGVKLLNDDANLPKRSTDGAAGYDLYASESCQIKPGNKMVISTGIAIELPDCLIPGHIYCMQIMSRSGLSAKNSIEKGAGLIDKDYKGEIKVILYNHTPRKEYTNEEEENLDTLYINIGDRIAQGVIVAVAIPEIVELSELTQTKRGTDGFGSTGYSNVENAIKMFKNNIRMLEDSIKLNNKKN